MQGGLSGADRQFLEGKKYVSTNIGVVTVCNFSEKIPQGWERLNYDEAKNFIHLLKKLLGQWSIVAFQQGKMDGRGYGYKIHQSYGPQCGEGFLLKRGAYL